MSGIIEPTSISDGQLVTVDDGGLDVDGALDLVAELQALAVDVDGQPRPIAAGTFVLYPMADGGMMFVTAVDDGLLKGIKHTRITPGLIRAVGVLAGGGSKLQALKALTFGGRRRYENQEIPRKELPQ